MSEPNPWPYDRIAELSARCANAEAERDALKVRKVQDEYAISGLNADLEAMREQNVELLEAISRIEKLENHQTFSCANGEHNNQCSKCISRAAIRRPEKKVGACQTCGESHKHTTCDLLV